MLIRDLSVLLLGILAFTNACEDRNVRCQTLPLELCDLDREFMKEHCARHCNFCLETMAKCGKTKNTQGRVVGGSNASPGAWPWQAAIFYKHHFYCGGTLVAPQWVITAAHCVENITMTKFYIIKLGERDLDKDENEQTFTILSVILNPDYMKPLLVNNDIALVKLSRPAVITSNVQTACLPDLRDEPQPSALCYMTGWGKLTHPGNLSRVLQQLSLHIQPNNLCDKKNKKYYPITDKMICAANINNKVIQSGCHGDSGGPLVCLQNSGSWKLYGAVSWGSPKCDSDDAYSVFQRVAPYREWIDKYILN